MSRMSIEDKLALFDSEVYQELERSEIRKRAQTLSDKIVQSPVAQKAITDGITKALENSADDGDELEKIKADVEKLDDEVLIEFFKMFSAELEVRDIDPDTLEKEDELEVNPEENEETVQILAYVKASLNKIAASCIEKNNTEAAYLVERTIQSIFNK